MYTFTHSSSVSSEEGCFKYHVHVLKCTYIYGPNSEVLGIVVGECLDSGFRQVRRTSRFDDLTFCFCSCIAKDRDPLIRQLFLDLLLTFVLSLILGPFQISYCGGNVAKLRQGSFVCLLIYVDTSYYKTVKG